MKKVLCFIVHSLCLGIALPVSAATLLEFKGSEGDTLKMWIDGHRARMETPAQQDGYILTDLKEKQMYVISDKERTIMDMSAGFRAQFSGDRPELADSITLEKMGSGPTILGYETEHYTVSVNGKVCGDRYVSRSVLNDTDLKEYARYSGRASHGPAISGILHSCDKADIALADKFKTIGYPLRSVDSDGDTHEVTRIEKNASIGPDAFELPQGYQTIDMEAVTMQGMAAMEQLMKRAEEAQEAEEEPAEETTRANPMDDIGDAMREGLKGLKGLFGQ